MKMPELERTVMQKLAPMVIRPSRAGDERADLPAMPGIPPPRMKALRHLLDQTVLMVTNGCNHRVKNESDIMR